MTPSRKCSIESWGIRWISFVLLCPPLSTHFVHTHFQNSCIMRIETKSRISVVTSLWRSGFTYLFYLLCYKLRTRALSWSINFFLSLIEKVYLQPLTSLATKFKLIKINLISKFLQASFQMLSSHVTSSWRIGQYRYRMLLLLKVLLNNTGLGS